jgi:2-succinyl-5-enolpyruvyl-6-hydroxy-3-cyclohexene-1-carboxylate synthase
MMAQMMIENFGKELLEYSTSLFMSAAFIVYLVYEKKQNRKDMAKLMEDHSKERAQWVTDTKADRHEYSQKIYDLNSKTAEIWREQLIATKSLELILAAVKDKMDILIAKS